MNPPRTGASAAMFHNAEAVLFDFDGTLIQQRIDFPLMRRRVLEAACRYGLDAEPLAGMYALELIAHVQRTLGAAGDHGQALARAFAEEAQRAVLEIELQAADGAHAFPGVPEMLRQLHARSLGVGIVTRNSRAAVERVLALNQMSYDVLLTRDDIVHVKPDPRHLLAALEVLGVAGDRAVMCGDHPMDVLVGRKVGAGTVGVLSEGQPADYFAEAQPDLVVSSVVEVLPHLRQP